MKTSIKNAAWAVLEYGFYPAAMILATPFFLNRLGQELYGQWMLCIAIAGVGTVLSVGTGAATVRTVAGHRAGASSADNTQLDESIGASLAVAMIFGGALAVCIFFIVAAGGRYLFSHVDARSPLVLTASTAAALLWLDQVDNVLSAIVKGLERFGVAARVEMAGKIGQISLSVLAVQFSASLASVFAALVCGGVLRIALKAWTAKEILGLHLRPHFSHRMRSTLAYARWGWITGAGSMLFSVGDRLLIGAVLGPISLSHYSVAVQLAQQVHALPAAALSVVLPRASQLHAENSPAGLRLATRHAFTASIIVASLLACTLLTLREPILNMWIGRTLAAQVSPLLLTLTAAYWLLSITLAPYFVLLAVGDVRFVGIISVISAVVAMPAMAISMHSLGEVGAPAGRFSYAIVMWALIMRLSMMLRSISRPTAKKEEKGWF